MSSHLRRVQSRLRGRADSEHAQVFRELAVRVAEGLRDHGLDVLFHCGGGGFKAQMKKADASGARFAVIIGDDEANAGEVTVKPLRSTGEQPNEQRRVAVDSAADEIMRLILDQEEL